MRFHRALLLCCTSALCTTPAMAADAAAADSDARTIVVTGIALQSGAATKTDTPALETPQPVTIISDDVYLAQGSVSISDTVRYVAGVQANPYGPDSRVDGALIRGINALQFRDGMRDIFSYYASIRADPYNFSQVQVVRGPASVLFGQGTLGGLINLTSKMPEFETSGEVSLRYGSFDRKEALADVTGALAPTLAGRIVARVRDADTQTDYVPDDRVMVAPSLTWKPTPDTDVTLLGLYQEDDGGSTSQFLPLIGTIYRNPNGRLPNDLFVGKPGWDRYDGRLLQGTAIVDHRFSDAAKISLKARYIDSDLDYFTHYADSYTNPRNPYLDAGQRLMNLYVDGSVARMEIFSTDNNAQFSFNTGAAVEHLLLAGVDYSWNRVRKTGGFAIETFDIYDIDYDALSDYGGDLPQPTFKSEDTRQDQLGFYLQDQIRLFDRASLVLGVRHDRVNSRSFGVKQVDQSATTFRAGFIAEVTKGISPFFSYTESFEPIAGTTSSGAAFIPKSGRQFEAGIKLHADANTLVTVTAYHIKEKNRPVSDDSTPDPTDQVQIGGLTSKGIEIEANATLPGDLNMLGNFSYNEAEIDGTGLQIDNVPKVNASVWGTKLFGLSEGTSLLIGGGVRYVGANRSYGPAFPDGVKTPDYTLVDAIAEVSHGNWSFAINATNLFDRRYYSACLARGDCFMGAERNVYGTVSYRF